MENNVYESSVQNDEQAGQMSEVTVVSNSTNEVVEKICTEQATTMDFSDEQAALDAEQSDLELGDESEEEKELSSQDSQQSQMVVGKSKVELIALFEELLETKPVASLRKDVELIKIAFYKTHRSEIEQQKKEFLATGNPIEEFVPTTDSCENTLKELFTIYRQKRDSYLKESEDEKTQNLETKLAIIEELKELTNGSETLNQTFASFKELQNRWKESGAVPKSNVKDLWETYHLHVENFYNFVKINKELRDLDLKKNYESQASLCEDAEALLLEESVVTAFHKLQKLHDNWREVGPVAAEYKEQLWERFKNVSTQINKRHQEHFEAIKAEQLANLALKNELCEKCENLAAQDFKTKAEWDSASEKLIEIQKVWKSIGFAPKKDNTIIYNRFRGGCDLFFEKKRDFYMSIKSQMDNNLQSKIALCVAAEAIGARTDWAKATEELLAIQKEWKEIGHVARKHSDQTWKRFRAACDSFFEAKSSHYGSLDSKYEGNLEKKRELMKEIELFDVTAAQDGFATLKEFQRRWLEIGFVPMKAKDGLNREYKTLIDSKFSLLRGNEKERKIGKFKERVSSLKGSDNRLKSEREKLLHKIKEIESDISLWENNIGFFSKSKNAQSLIDDVNAKIAKAKQEIVLLNEKIAIIVEG